MHVKHTGRCNALFFVHDARLDGLSDKFSFQETMSRHCLWMRRNSFTSGTVSFSNAGTEAALTELLRDRMQNYGSSQGQVTLPPYQTGRASFHSKCRGVVTARGRSLWKEVESDLMRVTRIRHLPYCVHVAASGLLLKCVDRENVMGDKGFSDKG